MPSKNKNDYTKNLRGNQDVFLADIMRSSEFQAIKNKYLANVFTGINSLLHRVDDSDETGRKILACADEVSQVFRISKDNATQLLLSPKAPAVYGIKYLPRVSRDGNEVVLRIGPRTTKADIDAVWNVIKSVQREIGKNGSKKSINPELAFCIHRQYVLKGRKMRDIFEDYTQQTLEGYDHPPTITFEDEFRKYYKQVVKGL